MQTHNLVQGSPEWHAYRSDHFNASDAPAMMGVSPYKTRAQLLHEMATGITEEVTPELQRVFNDGHRFEALARPLAEKIIGEELYPVTGSEGLLSASFDGLTLMLDAGFEHKSLNKELRAVMVEGCTGADLPMVYQVQCEQQCMVSGCERILFMASKWDGDTLVEERHCWYYPNPVLAASIQAGWDQFAKDLAEFKPTERTIAPVANVVTDLPAVSVQVSGAIAIKHNFSAFEVALRDFIDNRLIRKPETDQDFADLGEQIKSLEKAETALNAAEAQMLSQVEAVDLAKRSKDMLLKLARDNRLMAEKLLAARKDQIKAEQVQRGKDALAAHIEGLNARLGKPYMPAIHADFAGAIKNKRTIDSLREAVDTTLRNAKIEASAIADRIQINLGTLRELTGQHAFLFVDTAQIVLKANDDLTMLVKSRISEHEAKEAARLEAERERIRKEEEAKAERAAREAHDKARAAVAAIRFPAPEPVATAEPNKPAPSLVAANNAAKAEIAQAAPVATTGPLITTQALGDRLGLPVQASLIESLGFKPIKQSKPGVYWRECDVRAIGWALIERIKSHISEAVAA